VIRASQRQGKRCALSMRMTEGVRDGLERAADIAGRSLSAEVELRLEQSIRLDDIFGGPELRRIAYTMATAFALSGQYSAGPDVPPKEWLRGAAAITATRAVVDALMRALPFDDEALDRLGQNLVGAVASRRAQLHQERSE
jgi:hypothetical protein